jgi:hypothetical protein
MSYIISLDVFASSLSQAHKSWSIIGILALTYESKRTLSILGD